MFLSTNLKIGTLLSHELIESPFHETHRRLRTILHQTAHVIGLHITHVIDLRRFPLVAYDGSLRLLCLHARDYVKGYLRRVYECYGGVVDLRRFLRRFIIRNSLVKPTYELS